MEYTIENIARIIKEFCSTNNISVPTNIKEYDKIAEEINKTTRHFGNNTPRSIGRSVLCKHGLIASDIIKYITPTIENTTAYGFNKYLLIGEKLNLQVDKYDLSISDKAFSQTNKVTITCKECGFAETITATSLNRRKQGCKKCLKQANWIYREPEFLLICANKGVTPKYTEYKSILKSTSVQLTCNTCGTAFSRSFNNIIYQDKYPTNCPVCKPDKVFGKEGVVTVVNGIEFDSKMEANSYSLLLEFLPKSSTIEHHVPYRNLGLPSYSFIADFLIDNLIVLEVSSFNIDHHKEYFERIAHKKALIDLETKYIFKFCNTLAEVKTLIDEYTD